MNKSKLRKFGYLFYLLAILDVIALVVYVLVAVKGVTIGSYNASMSKVVLYCGATFSAVAAILEFILGKNAMIQVETGVSHTGLATFLLVYNLIGCAGAIYSVVNGNGSVSAILEDAVTAIILLAYVNTAKNAK